MEAVQKTKIEVWEIVLKGFELFPNVSIGGVFCLIRQKNFISWGEWYYLHDVLNKWISKGCQGGNNERDGLPKLMIKNLKENAKN